jgi:hypothetical protein
LEAAAGGQLRRVATAAAEDQRRLRAQRGGHPGGEAAEDLSAI